MFQALEGVSSFDSLSKSAKQKGDSVLHDRDEVIKEAKRAVVKEPDVSPSKIIEQEMAINSLELIYVPFYDLTIEAKGQRKVIQLNALTGEDYAL